MKPTALLQRGSSFLHYLRNAQGRHGVHSPFIYKLVEDVLQDRQSYPSYAVAENLAKELRSSKESISRRRFGAESLADSAAKVKVSALAGSSAVPVKYGRLLHRLVKYFQPRYCLELGTSLGVSAAYMAAAMQELSTAIRPENKKFTTIEGDEEIFSIAKKNFTKLNLDFVEAVNGNFKDVLPQVLQSFPQLDFVFIDGDHQKQPTLQYFEQCLKKVHKQSVIIFDDIHWSAEMEEAWSEIKQHPAVTLSADLYRLGLVFFHEDRAKQHFTLKY